MKNYYFYNDCYWFWNDSSSFKREKDRYIQRKKENHFQKYMNQRMKTF